MALTRMLRIELRSSVFETDVLIAGSHPRGRGRARPEPPEIDLAFRSAATGPRHLKGSPVISSVHSHDGAHMGAVGAKIKATRSERWSGWQALPLRPPASKAGALLAELHPDTGTRPGVKPGKLGYRPSASPSDDARSLAPGRGVEPRLQGPQPCVLTIDTSPAMVGPTGFEPVLPP